MSKIDGKWKLSFETPLGKREPILIIRTDGNSISGTWDGEEVMAEFTHGELDGDNIMLYRDSPAGDKTVLVATISGENLSAEVEGAFGKFQVIGTRI